MVWLGGEQRRRTVGALKPERDSWTQNRENGGVVRVHNHLHVALSVVDLGIWALKTDRRFLPQSTTTALFPPKD